MLAELKSAVYLPCRKTRENETVYERLKKQLRWKSQWKTASIWIGICRRVPTGTQNRIRMNIAQAQPAGPEAKQIVNWKIKGWLRWNQPFLMSRCNANINIYKPYKLNKENELVIVNEIGHGLFWSYFSKSELTNSSIFLYSIIIV